MRQGTTPIHTFTLPYDTSFIKEVLIIYKQDEKEVMCKRTNDCEFNGNIVSVALTQDDTFLFDHNENVRLQIRALTNDGNALGSNIFTVSVEECLNKEVLK